MKESPTTTPRRRFRVITRKAVWRLSGLFFVIVLVLGVCWHIMLRMPGRSHRGPLPPRSPAQVALAAELRGDVETLAVRIGRRSTFHPAELERCADFIAQRLESAGYQVNRPTFVSRGEKVSNIEAVLKGTANPAEIVVVGAHYDSYDGLSGADDNASGVAGVIALANRFAQHPQARTIRFVLFVNEEPPAFWTPDMGSWVYAKACRAAGDKVVGMLSLESIGCYSDRPGSQHYPPPLGSFFPDTGNFIAFVGNTSSRSLVHDAIGMFRATTPFPSEGAALPGLLPGVGWSDHWSFWKEGYPALMVTATAPYRNEHYHTPADRPEDLDYERTARVVDGLERVVRHLAGEAGPGLAGATAR